MHLLPHYRRLFSCVWCVFLLAGAWSIGAQTGAPSGTQQATPEQGAATPAPAKKPSSKKAPETATPDKSKDAKPASSADPTSQEKADHDAAVAEFEAQLADTFDSSGDNGDYVPCFFTASQLLALRPSAPTPRLTSEEAERLSSAVMTEVLSAASAKIFSQAERAEIVKEVSEQDFEGLSPSVALAKVILILQTAEKMESRYKKWATSTTGTAIGKESADELIDAAVEEASEAGLAALSKGSGPTSADIATLKEEMDKYRANLGTLNLDTLTGPEAVSRISSSSVLYIPKRQLEMTAELKAQAQAKQSPGRSPQEAASNSTSEIAAADLGVSTKAPETTPGQKAALTGAGTAAKSAKSAITDHSNENKKIVDSSRSLVASFKRPPDVGCAMSILSWSETRYAFGRLIANEYIGIQIVVRNINDKQEFLMHDAAIAVDSDLTGRKGRFFSGRDRLIVRALTVDQKDDSPRNIFMNVLSGVGTLLTAVVPFTGAGNFTDAATAFNTALVPAIGKSRMDNGTDQIKLLDDIGFSSPANQKKVVPNMIRMVQNRSR
jgi:hypothetical protein